MISFIGALPKYMIYRILKTKCEIVIFDEDYSVKVNNPIELLGIKKREPQKEIGVTS